MLSLYEILKASKTGIAPDMWTALAGMNWGGADSGHEIKELTGIPPLSFRADGTPLLDYLISGNTVQNGTGTPDSPVMPEGCGDLEATGEHAGQYKIPISSGGVTTNIYLGSTQTVRQIKKLVLTGEENWSRAGDAVGQTPYFRIAYFTSAKPTNVVCTHYISPNGNISVSNQVEGTKVQTSSEVEIALIVRPPEFAVWSADDFKSFLAQQYATGTPVTIWYVLATPETAAVNEPLMKIGGYADTLSMEQAGVQIPTLHGNTVIDVETELKPSEMYIKYQK